MIEVINTDFEFELRLIMLLSVDKCKSFSIDKLTLLDFICTYSRDFNLDNQNLHGNNDIALAELNARRCICRRVIKKMIATREVDYSFSKIGLVVTANNSSLEINNSLSVDYSNQYRLNAKKAIDKYYSCSDLNLLKLVCDMED